MQIKIETAPCVMVEKVGNAPTGPTLQGSAPAFRHPQKLI